MPPYLTALTPRVYTSPPDEVRDRPVLGVFAGSHSTLMVDAGASARHAAEFLRGLMEVGVRPPSFVALTHWHWDHVFGAAALDATLMAHEETRRRIQAMARLDWRSAAINARVAAGEEIPMIAEHVVVELSEQERAHLVLRLPDLTFGDGAALDLGDMLVHLQHVGGDHTPDAVVIYASEERVAFLGDCFYPGFVGKEHFYTRARLLPLLDTLEALPVDWYVMGHDPQPWSRAMFAAEAARLRRLAGALDAIGPHRAALLAALANPDDPYLEEDIDSFLRGLQPDVAVNGE